MRRLILAGTFVAAALFLSASSAQAAQICNGCDYIGPVGTYIGVYNPDNFDFGTFEHADVLLGVAVDDRWVFDIAPSGDGSVSVDFTFAAPFTAFSGALYEAGATTCGDPLTPSGCTVAVLGNQVAGDIDGSLNQIETGIVNLTAGRYIFQVLATGGSPQGTYTGQVATRAVVPEPALLSLLGLGLAVAARRRRKA